MCALAVSHYRYNGGDCGPRCKGPATQAITLAQRPYTTPGQKKPPGERRGVCVESSRSISRVLSRATIHLRQLSPVACSDLPESTAGHGIRIPIWSCSRWGLPSPPLLPATRCALTAPFHPYPANRAVYFLLHFPWALAPQALPGTLPCGARTFLPREAS